MMQPSRNALSSGTTISPWAQDPALARAHQLLAQSAQDHASLLPPPDETGASGGASDADAVSAAKTRLASAVGAAAALSNTPEKWAATIALLHRLGIDPEGYEDFGQGRLQAAAEAGLLPQAARPIQEIPTG
jgi:hypothetical protein